MIYLFLYFTKTDVPCITLHRNMIMSKGSLQVIGFHIMVSFSQAFSLITPSSQFYDIRWGSKTYFLHMKRLTTFGLNCRLSYQTSCLEKSSWYYYENPDRRTGRGYTLITDLNWTCWGSALINWKLYKILVYSCGTYETWLMFAVWLTR